MSVLNILFVGSDEVARSIAKKSDSRDVDNYIYKDLKEGGLFSTISMVQKSISPITFGNRFILAIPRYSLIEPERRP